MITDLLVGVLVAMIDALLSLLPSWSPPGFSDISASVVTQMVYVGSILPVQAAVNVLLAILASLAAAQSWSFFVWVWHQFHGAD